MPSSRGFGSRPRVSRISVYSRRVSPTEAGPGGLARRKSPPHPGTSQRLEQAEAIDAAENGLGAALRMGHEPEHVAGLVAHASDSGDGAIGIGGVHDLPILGAVAEHDLTALLHARQ